MLFPPQVSGHVPAFPTLITSTQALRCTQGEDEGGRREPVPAGRGLAGTARRGAGPREIFGCLWGTLLSQVCGTHGCVSLWEGKCVLITVSHSQSHRTGAGHALPQLMPALRAELCLPKHTQLTASLWLSQNHPKPFLASLCYLAPAKPQR